MAWKWETASAKERADFIRSHGEFHGRTNPLSREQIARVFSLSLVGVDKIMSGDDWRLEYQIDPEKTSP